MYRCDKKTPALKCYPPAKCDTGIPLDINNPDVVKFQIAAGVLPAKNEGYSAIAWDNFDLGNAMKACGHYSSGKWVQVYNPETSASRAQYAEDVIRWTRTMSMESHKINMLMVPNWGGLVDGNSPSSMWNSKSILAIGNVTDGALDEAGFTDFGQERVQLGEQWENRVKFALNQQRFGKSYYSISQYGKWNGHWGPASHHTPNISVAVHAWVLASYLMTNVNASGTTLVCAQCYGYAAVNFSWWPEDATKVINLIHPASHGCHFD